MPRNPEGTPAVRSLCDQLVGRGIFTTPRQLEALRQDKLGPAVTGQDPPDARIVAHYAALLPMVGQGKSRAGVAARMALHGYDIDPERVRADLLTVSGAECFPIAERAASLQVEPLGTHSDVVTSQLEAAEDDDFATAEAILRRTDSAGALDESKRAIRQVLPTGNPLAESADAQVGGVMQAFASAYCGIPMYATNAERLAEMMGGLSGCRSNPVDTARAADVFASPQFTYEALFVETFRTADMAELVVSARALRPLAKWVVSRFTPSRSDDAITELAAFGIAAGMMSLRRVHAERPAIA